MVRYQYNIRTGDIHNPSDVIIFSENDGLPDGMTIDEEGCLWIAHWGGSKITRWNPSTGEQILSIPIPALYVTSCTFGGPNLTDLYVTTARTRMTIEINLLTEEMISTLKSIYKEWKELKVEIKELAYNIVRNERHIRLKTNAITFVIRK